MTETRPTKVQLDVLKRFATQGPHGLLLDIFTTPDKRVITRMWHKGWIRYQNSLGPRTLVFVTDAGRAALRAAAGEGGNNA